MSAKKNDAIAKCGDVTLSKHSVLQAVENWSQNEWTEIPLTKVDSFDYTQGRHPMLLVIGIGVLLTSLLGGALVWSLTSYPPNPSFYTFTILLGGFFVLLYFFIRKDVLSIRSATETIEIYGTNTRDGFVKALRSELYGKR